MPLFDEALLMELIGRGERLHQAGERGVVAVAERDGDGELAAFGDVDLAHQREVAVHGLAEVPGHAHVRAEVLVAVARAHISAAGAGERGGC